MFVQPESNDRLMGDKEIDCFCAVFSSLLQTLFRVQLHFNREKTYHCKEVQQRKK